MQFPKFQLYVSTSGQMDATSSSLLAKTMCPKVQIMHCLAQNCPHLFTIFLRILGHIVVYTCPTLCHITCEAKPPEKNSFSCQESFAFNLDSQLIEQTITKCSYQIFLSHTKYTECTEQFNNNLQKKTLSQQTC